MRDSESNIEPQSHYRLWIAIKTTHHDLALQKLGRWVFIWREFDNMPASYAEALLRLGIRTEKLMIMEHILPSSNKRPPVDMKRQVRPENELLCVPRPVNAPKLNLTKSDFWNISLFWRIYALATGSMARSLGVCKRRNRHTLIESKE